MKLFEHDEFEQAMLRAAAEFGVSEQFIEKDYYVTEILRMIADELGDKAMFKGGTSLSKGWKLITRFSEDIDLFVDPQKFDPVPGTRRMDKILKDLTEAVADHPALTWRPEEGKTISGFGREDYLAYETRFGELPGISPTVRLEPGIRSGTFPTELVPITSFVAQYLLQQGRADMAEDLTGFNMTLLHYRRTFVEKMFALHGKVIQLQEENRQLARDARHYPDLYALAGEHEVRAMLASGEYDEIKQDYDAISREFFPNSYRPPENLSFADSPAFFPNNGLRVQLARDHETQCSLLFSGATYPTFDDVLGRFEEIRSLL